ncbi:hypothetical protein [Catenovulum agarivorans]|uniref:hypothetical protein n=1 Tax=Catenovulum agarivorans TaxID=1172192 RepID=UPI0002E55797|nr:hypothetical protein [Catenovulum agarivorans]
MSKIEHAIQTALEIICQLHNENKTVSVAAVRNRALLPLPLPAITKAVSAFKENPETYLKAWQHNNPQAIAVEEPEVEQLTELTLEQRVVQLEQQVAQLQQALDKLVNKVD